MTPNLKSLRAAAEKATPGPWELHTDACATTEVRAPSDSPFSKWQTICDDETYYPAAVGIEDMTFIALANPATVLALVEVCERARAVMEWVGVGAGELRGEDELRAMLWAQDRLREALSAIDHE